MTEVENPAKNERLSFAIYAILCFVVAGGLIVAYAFGDLAKNGELVGVDGYVHLTRAAELYHTGDWYHPAPMKTNTPYEATLHWTRPFDVLLLAGAVPLSAVMNFESALFWWGGAVSPVLFFFTLLALHWAFKGLLSRDALYFIIFIICFQVGIASCYQAGRPDHHSLLALLFVLLVGFGLRLAMAPFSRKMCWTAGAAAALAVWVSVESVVMTGLMAAVLGGYWLVHRGDFLRKNLHFCGAFSVCLLAALLAERPLSEIGAMEYDRLSMVYVCLFALIATFWVVVTVIDLKSSVCIPLAGRICCGITGAGSIGFIMYLLFPKFYDGSLANMDPRIIPIWFNHIQEIQPLVFEKKSLVAFIQVLGGLCVGVIYAGRVLVKTNDTAKRRGWILLALVTAAFCFLAFGQIRWLVYPQLLLGAVLAEVLVRILTLLKDRGPVVVRALIKSAVILTFSMGFLCLGFLADRLLQRDNSEYKMSDVSLIALCDYLNQQDASDGKHLRLLTYNNFASEILYRTDCEVVGSNYHRNGQGIVDNHRVLTAEADQTAYTILKEREIDLILLQPEGIPRPIRECSSDVTTFCQRLCEGQLPAWLKKVELPEALTGDFLVFETDF